MTKQIEPMVALKPCPFCGGDAESDMMQGFRRMKDGALSNAVAIYCTKCTAQVQMCHEDFKEYAPEDLLTMLTEAWNRRGRNGSQPQTSTERSTVSSEKRPTISDEASPMTTTKETGSEPCVCSDDALRWLEMEEADWRRKQRGEWPEARDVADIINDPEPPEWHQRDMEYQYRKGFYHGIAEAAELIVRLYRRAGYVRPQEIANIIGDWTNDLRKWKSKALHEEPLQSEGHPKLHWVAWPEMKRRTHERDEWACTQCGETGSLEAHHIEAVCNGGLPELENLVTLCEPCHRQSDA